MKTWLALAAPFLAVISIALSATPALPPPAYVQVRGREFVDPHGEVLRLRGTNLGNWLLAEGYMWHFDAASSPRKIENVIAELVGDVSAAEFWREWRERYITHEDIRRLRALGFNSLRIPLNWRLFVSENAPFEMAGPGWALLDRAIAWCREEKLYVILDLHGAPGGQTGANIDDSRGRPLLFDDPAAQQLTIDLWKALAARYRDETWVLGYDLLNEPIADYHDTKRLNPLLGEFYRRLVPAIRAVDPHHVIFLGGAQWNTQFDMIAEPFAPNLAYAFHMYWEKPDDKVIAPYLALREKTNLPLWLAESGENSDEWVGQFRTTLEAHQIGWCFWPYKKMDATRGVSSFARPDDWAAIVKYAENPGREDFEELRKAVPPLDVARRALAQLLENIRAEHCRINAGYVRALGLTPPPPPAP
jgi:aryl-phospho-beta-D-glucosidase BglC (GH1 family)